MQNRHRHRRTTLRLNDAHHVRITDDTTADDSLCTSSPCSCPVTLTCTCNWSAQCAHHEAPAAVLQHGHDTNSLTTKAIRS